MSSSADYPIAIWFMKASLLLFSFLLLLTKMLFINASPVLVPHFVICFLPALVRKEDGGVMGKRFILCEYVTGLSVSRPRQGLRLNN